MDADFMLREHRRLREEVRQAAIRLSVVWIRVRTSQHRVSILRTLWIDLVKSFEDLLMRNFPELREIIIGQDYTPSS